MITVRYVNFLNQPAKPGLRDGALIRAFQDVLPPASTSNAEIAAWIARWAGIDANVPFIVRDEVDDNALAALAGCLRHRRLQPNTNILPEGI